MDEILKDINAVVGVVGSFLCDTDGNVLSALGTEDIEHEDLSTAARVLAQTMAALSLARRRKVGDIDFVYDRGRLVVKNTGEGCLCIIGVPNINVPLLNLTADLAIRNLKKRAKEARASGQETALPGLREAVRAMADFFESLAAELGDRGFGRQEFLKIAEHRLARMKGAHPVLSSIRISEGRIDLSQIPLDSFEAGELGAALVDFVRGLCFSARGILGHDEATSKYLSVYEPFRQRNEAVLRALGIGEVLKDAVSEEPPRTIGGVEFHLS